MAMQLQEFAKQVLFGSTIEEKLNFPREEIIDTHPGSRINTPAELSRPSHLSLRHDGVRAKHPKAAKLVDEKERGRLLHFFANHELLATELMALALLKFPDAPASFRQGLLDTLKDEQIHTRLYMHRMKQCGVEFGELPLSDYFWKSVSTMEDPLDYVTRLSLTFEQANLDYSREYSKIFQDVGDHATANILDRIYTDEIGHVGFGLKWFRQWKAAGKTDWQVYRERLHFPLSPSRAKGNIFNAKGRADAGLDPKFIDDLKLFQQSRGRTPTILWFNPDAEKYAAQNSHTGYDSNTSSVQEDLSFLPAFLGRQDDILVMPQRPTDAFLSRIQESGIPLPEILINKDPANQATAPKVTRKVGRIRPWAWTPDSLAYFENTLDSVTRHVNPDTLWNPKIRELFSKLWSIEFGKRLAQQSPDSDWLAPSEVYGKSAASLEELTTLRKRFQKSGYPNLVCKAPFGTAAQSNRCLLENETLTPQLANWLQTIWSSQGAIIVEPWLDRVFDFSIQYEKKDTELKPLGFTRLVNNPRGQFKGIITNGFCNGLAPELTRFIMQRIEDKPRLYRWYEQTLGPNLAEQLDQTSFHGPLGIDAFIYRDPKGALRLKTIAELNPRYTMGRIAHELSERNAAGSIGYFQILNTSQLRKTKTKNFQAYCDQLQKAHPIQLSTEAKPRIQTGTLPLTDPQTAQRFQALYHIRKSIKDLPL